MGVTPYDLYPYESGPHRRTHPDGLALEAWKAGIEAVHPSRCRLLELGVADASNVLPMAFHLPDARLVGVDSSRVQVESALAARDRLGLDNLDVRQADILDVETEEVDYLIAHGVFSWVPPEVQDRILALAGAHLAENGLAYVSYNALPGWGVRGQVRHLMCAQTTKDAAPADRIDAAKQVLETLARALSGAQGPYQHLLKGEVDLARSRSDSCLLHEFLAPYNEAFHAEAFLERAAEHGLEFVAELSPLSTDTWGERTLRAELKAQARDARDLERWIDLLHYRQFRATLLRRKDTCGSAPDDLTLVGRCWAAGALRPEERRPSLDVGVTETFITASGTKITADEPVLKAALLEIGKSWPGGVSFEELAVRVLARLALRRIRTKDLDESQRRALASDLVALQTLGHLELRVRPLDCAQQPPAQPAVTALTRFEAETHGWASTPWHAAVPLDPLDRELVQALDGSRNIDALVELTCRAVREERVSILLEDGQSPDEGAMRRIVPRLLGQRMLRFAAHGLLRPER